MATTLTPVNPRVVAGPVMQTRNILILNGQSWKAGQFLYQDSAGLLKAAASDAVNYKYYALTDQTDPGNSTTYAEVGVIHPDHVFEINELDGVVDAANVGQIYGINVTSNVVTLDEAETSAVSLKVLDIASNYAPLRNAADDIKGRCTVSVLASVLNAANA